MRALFVGLVLGAVSLLFASSNAEASTTFVALSGGGRHTCAVTEEGGVLCWGLNTDGQVGDGTFESRSLPTEVVGLGDGVSEVSAGLTHTCAVTASGTATCWGENNGRLGDGREEPSPSPVEVCADVACEGPLTEVASISTGGSHSCAALNDGAVVCWGNNEDGQLGNGSTDDALTPVPVVDLPEAVAISLGTSSSCALTVEGAVFCWGSNVEGQIGDDRVCGMRCPLPQPVAGLESGVSQLSVAGLHACALTDAGAVLCWGLNFDGQVGDGTEDNIRIVATQVVGLEEGVDSVSAGGRFRGHACALLEGDELQCWGDNDAGQVGDGTTDDRLVPVAVSPPQGLVHTAAGDAHMCGLTNAADVLCWGSNNAGQFGDGTTEDSLTPTLAIASKASDTTLGDANCDGAVTSIDAALILQFTANLLTDLECSGDANTNGSVDAVDAALVLQLTAGLLEAL